MLSYQEAGALFEAIATATRLMKDNEELAAAKAKLDEHATTLLCRIEAVRDAVREELEEDIKESLKEELMEELKSELEDVVDEVESAASSLRYRFDRL